MTGVQIISAYLHDVVEAKGKDLKLSVEKCVYVVCV